MEPIVIATRMTKEEFVRVSTHLTWRQFARTSLWMFVLTFLIVLLFLAMHGPSLRTGVLFLMFALMIAWLVIRIRTRTRKLWEENFRSHEQVTYTLRSEGCGQVGETFRTETPWPRFQRIELWEDHYLFYRSPSLAYVIHRRALQAGQEERLRTLLDQVRPGWRK